MSIDECKRALIKIEGNKTTGTNGPDLRVLSIFLELFQETYGVEFKLCISTRIIQRQGIISFNPER